MTTCCALVAEGGNARGCAHIRTTYGEQLATDAPYLSGKERRLFATRNRQMMGSTLILLVAVCLIAGGFEHKKNLRKYNRK